VYPTVEYYTAGTARDTGTVDAPGTYAAGQAPPPHSIRRGYDQAGNLAQTQEVNPVRLGLGTVIVGGGAQARTDYAFPTSSESVAASFFGQQQIATTYTYRPDGKLVRVDRQGTCVYSNSYEGGCTTTQPAYNDQTRTELFRYDALGRRVWVRTATLADGTTLEGGCVFRCDNTVRRTVWAGDHVLAEIRYPWGQREQDTGLDSLNVIEKAHRDARQYTDAGHPYGGRNTSDWAQHGRVLYVHGGGMDQPLGLVRMDYSYDIPGPVAIVPHASWRGTYETASFVTANCDTVWLPYSEVVFQDSTGKKANPAIVTDEFGVERDTLQVRCVEVDLPGKIKGMTRFLRRQTASGPISWMGSLMQDAQDASGLIFRRNRYYDASTGRFTQEDPIGLAGGVNAYGFAEGDPVNYGDPYGLCKKDKNGREDPDCLRVINLLTRAVGAAEREGRSGTLFRQAANIYRRTDRDVRFVSPTCNCMFHSWKNNDGNLRTLVLGQTVGLNGPILLRNDMGPGDVVATAAHEALIHAENDDANGFGQHFGDLSASTNQTNQQLWQNLPTDLRTSGEYWRWKLCVDHRVSLTCNPDRDF